MGKESWIGFAIGLGGAIAGNLIGDAIANRSYIPRTEQVQQGYIAPSKLEIECKDLDGNGEPETIMKIGDKPYLLREVDGKPVISAYEIKPAEVVPKSE
ncbi:MAG: hypothetical protein U9Q06_04550 [Nanoarchaeota archaeon]|nr:hypothetical protein [Nanoarchaeota archaeon]